MAGVDAGLPAEAVRVQLQKVLSNSSFASSERRCRVLSFLVECALAAEQDQVKESLIAVKVFGKDPSYDPKIDGIVRVEIGRLRSKLYEYYAMEGAGDPIRIDIPKGAYVPTFTGVAETASPVAPVERAHNRTKRVAGAALVAVIAAGLLLFALWPAKQSGAPAGKSIAILPFVNLSSDPDSEYFSDGLVDELTDELANLGDLRVVARTSSFKFKGKNEDIRSIAKQLNVGQVVEGSVQKSGNRIRVMVQLNRASDGYHMWSQVFVMEYKDLFSIQDEISRSIARALRLHLASGDQQRLVKRETGSQEAHDLSLRGRYFRSKLTRDGVAKSIEYFEQAIRVAPKYADAYTGLAQSEIALTSLAVVPPLETLSKAREHALTALGLDSSLGQAYAQIAFVTYVLQYDWTAAEQDYRRALELAPGVASVHLNYGTALMLRGRFNEALEQFRLTRDLDPLSLGVRVSRANTYILMREYAAAEAECGSILEMDPNSIYARFSRGMNYIHMGRYPEAIVIFQGLIAASPDVLPGKVGLAMAYALSGKRNEAEKLVAELEHQASRQYVSPYQMAAAYARLGMRAKALASLEKAYQLREFALLVVRFEPTFESLHQDVRFIELLKKTGVGP